MMAKIVDAHHISSITSLSSLDMSQLFSGQWETTFVTEVKLTCYFIAVEMKRN